MTTPHDGDLRHELLAAPAIALRSGPRSTLSWPLRSGSTWCRWPGPGPPALVVGVATVARTTEAGLAGTFTLTASENGTLILRAKTWSSVTTHLRERHGVVTTMRR